MTKNNLVLLIPILFLAFSCSDDCFDDIEDINAYCHENLQSLEFLMSATDSLENGGWITSMYRSKEVLFYSNEDSGKTKRRVFQTENLTIANAMNRLSISSIAIDTCGNKTFNFSCPKNSKFNLISVKDGNANCIEEFSHYMKLGNEFYCKRNSAD